MGPSPPEPGSATASLSSTAEFESLLPTRLAGRLAEVADDDTFGALATEAALLFSDISGFTRLTEKLIGDQGLEGVDQLTEILDAQFGTWVGFVTDRGGEVIKFAGDALLAVWFADDCGGLEEATAAAGDCALAMAEAMAERGAVAGVSLSLRVGIGAGDFSAARVGGVRGRWEIVAGGHAMTQIGPVLAGAQRGSVVASRAAWSHCEDKVTGDETGSGMTLTGTHTSLAGVDWPADESTSGAQSSAFEAYLPAVVRSHLERGLGAFLAEHRRVTVLFTQLRGLSVEGEAWAERLHDAVGAVQEELYKHGGALDKVSVDDKGVVVVAAFGLPSAQFEYRPGAAVTAAMDIERRLAGLGVEAGIGVTTGKVFCGPVGSEQRREYTMIGDVVNLSARLMSAGPGIITDAETRRLAGEAADWAELPPMAVKGLRADTTPHRPRRRAEAPRPGPSRQLAFVGRSDEFGELTRLMRTARTSESCVVFVEGEAGVGKTRLLQEATAALQRDGIGIRTGHALPTLGGTPYGPWLEILPEALGVDPAATPVQRLETMEAALAYDPAHRHLLPLLSDLLDLDLPDNEHTAELTGQARGETTRALIGDLLADRSETHPMVIVLEDLHWADSASVQLVLEVLRAGLPLTLIVTARPSGSRAEPTDELRGLVEHRVRLRALGSPSVEALLREELRATAVDPTLAEWMFDRSGGNPFVCGELLTTLSHHDALKVTGGRAQARDGVAALDALQIPATVEGLVVGRLDRLTPLEQLVVKTSAVVGIEFDLGLLAHVLPEAARETDLAETLAALVDARLLDRLDAPDEPRWVLRQGIVRGIAYDALVSAPRRTIHAAVAERLEELHAGHLEAVYGVLAHHFSGARRFPETVKYLELAGTRAIVLGVPGDAIDRFEEVRALADKYPDEAAEVTTPLQRTSWLRHLARAHLDLGAHGRTGELVAKGLAELGFKLPATDGAWGRLLMSQFFKQTWYRWFPPKRPLDERLAEAAELVRVFINIAYWEYDSPIVFPAATLWCTNLHQASGAVPRRSLLANVGLVVGGFGMGKTSLQYFERARALPVSQEDTVERYYSAVAEAMHHMMAMRWDENADGLDRMRAAGEAVSNDRLIGQADITRGFCHLNQGRIAEAVDLFDGGIAAAVRLGNPRDEFGGRLNKALALWELDRGPEARAEWKAARSVYGDDPPPDVRSWEHTWRAVQAAAEGDRAATEAAAAGVYEAVGPQPKFDLTYVLQFRRLIEALLEVGADATPALKLLAKQTKAFTLAKPGLQLLQARAKGSTKQLEKALAAARSGSMKLDEAEALAALGRLDEARALADEHGLTRRGNRWTMS